MPLQPVGAGRWKNELYPTPCFWKSSCYQVHKYWDGRARAPATLVVKTTFLSEQWRIQSTAVTKLITRPTVHGIQKKHIFVKTLRVRVRVESDDRLFSETLNNSTHTLHTLLPPQHRSTTIWDHARTTDSCQHKSVICVQKTLLRERCIKTVINFYL